MTETIEVKKWGNRFVIEDGAGEWFENDRGQFRTYTRPGSAIAFLRNSGYPWIVKMPSGRTLHINCDDPALEDTFGPHGWRKQNAITLSDRYGLYDVWVCRICRKEVKRYGLSGRPQGGFCKKNPVDAASKE
jgi:hypothetical protein